jgi:hypothetical protein
MGFVLYYLLFNMHDFYSLHYVVLCLMILPEDGQYQ